MRICIICNGFADERGVSINSAKSIYEILESYSSIDDIQVVFIDENKGFFPLKKEFLFANTVEDFIHSYKEQDLIKDYVKYLQSFDKVFLATHGTFGEDGELQSLLEKNNISYIGNSSETSSATFSKLKTIQTLWKHNICQPWLAELYENEEQLKRLLVKYTQLCIKPNDGGSSIGVKICLNFEESIKHIQSLQKQDYEPLIEEVHQGVEFSICLINGVAADPTEIINEGIFTYAKKYLPSNKVSYRHPAAFPLRINNKIKQDSENIYNIFKCRSFLRIDGFYNKRNKSIIYTDLNTIPGFQINGFFFKHKSHFKVMEELLQIPPKLEKKNKKNVYVVFGGDSSEQNVSIISGTNVVFNLNKSGDYNVVGCFMYKKQFWLLNYTECFQTSIRDFQYIIKNRQSMNIWEFVELLKKNKAILFNGLHGGIGENGTLQKILEKNKVLFTGSNSKISRLCMDKHKTNRFISSLQLKSQMLFDHLYIPKELLLKNFKDYDISTLQKLFPAALCIKPKDDGCSVGVSIINSLQDLEDYQKAIQSGQTELNGIPLSLKSKDYLLQEYIKTDVIVSVKSKIIKQTQIGWFEGTLGTLGKEVFIPSVCLSTHHTLTMEEKFLQGTGTNLTPIPYVVADQRDIEIIQSVIQEVVIKYLKIHTYCRVDYFYNTNTKKVMIIEINTLPALTPATVLFQQAIHNNITPKLLMERILALVNKS